MATTKESLKYLRKRKKELLMKKNALGGLDKATRFEIIKINDYIKECKRNIL